MDRNRKKEEEEKAVKQKLHKWIKKPCLILAAVLLCMLQLCPIQVLAYSRIDTSKETSFLLNTEFPGYICDIYYVGTLDETSDYQLVEPYASYPIELEDLDTAGWADAAKTLSEYVQRDGITADQRLTADETGTVSATSLSTGLYLILGQPVEKDGFLYEMTPTLLALPNLDQDNEWNYDLVLHAKFDRTEIIYPVRVEVVKVWKGVEAGQEPASVTVQLLKDGVVFEEAALNKANNWSFVWEQLDGKSVWTVVEKECPKGYTVSQHTEGDKTTITNTKTSVTPGVPKLPQTGQLWWPVPCLIALGLLFVMIGMLKRRNE